MATQIFDFIGRSGFQAVQIGVSTGVCYIASKTATNIPGNEGALFGFAQGVLFLGCRKIGYQLFHADKQNDSWLAFTGKIFVYSMMFFGSILISKASLSLIERSIQWGPAVGLGLITLTTTLFINAIKMIIQRGQMPNFEQVTSILYPLLT
jgi:hypothetical protein